jgi:hypothetical protein
LCPWRYPNLNPTRVYNSRHGRALHVDEGESTFIFVPDHFLPSREARDDTGYMDFFKKNALYLRYGACVSQPFARRPTGLNYLKSLFDSCFRSNLSAIDRHACLACLSAPRRAYTHTHTQTHTSSRGDQPYEETAFLPTNIVVHEK